MNFDVLCQSSQIFIQVIMFYHPISLIFLFPQSVQTLLNSNSTDYFLETLKQADHKANLGLVFVLENSHDNLVPIFFCNLGHFFE